MSLKIEFVERAEKGEPIARLCREFSVSRATGHKWRKRFRDRGYEGLEEESRRPKSAPLATAEDIVLAVLAARDAHPNWGPKTLVPLLRRRLGELTPSERTVCRILQRARRVAERRKRTPVSMVEKAPEYKPGEPNDLWTIDFKGWWRVGTGNRCEPLTVRDAFSRYVLQDAHCSPTTAEVHRHMERLFRKYGVPRAIQCDNGPPFVSVRSPAGISRLSAWWISLGIVVVRSRPACPQDNGGHERMHRDIKAEVQRHPSNDLASEQRRLARFRQEFNHVRPHQALNGRTPAEVYRPTEKRKMVPIEHVYPDGIQPTLVYSCGSFLYQGQKYYISDCLRGYRIGIQYVNPLQVRAWFYEIDLGIIEVEPAVDDSIFDRTARKRHKSKTKLQRKPTATVNLS